MSDELRAGHSLLASPDKVLKSGQSRGYRRVLVQALERAVLRRPFTGAHRGHKTETERSDAFAHSACFVRKPRRSGNTKKRTGGLRGEVAGDSRRAGYFRRVRDDQRIVCATGADAFGLGENRLSIATA